MLCFLSDSGHDTTHLPTCFLESGVTNSIQFAQEFPSFNLKSHVLENSLVLGNPERLVPLFSLSFTEETRPLAKKPYLATTSFLQLPLTLYLCILSQTLSGAPFCCLSNISPIIFMFFESFLKSWIWIRIILITNLWSHSRNTCFP